jgi:acyl-CoA synthetase (AMP-forming)/AMP-acid ligase II
MVMPADYPRRCAERWPEKPAILCGPHRVTYGALEARTRRYHELTHEWQLQPGGRVALLARNSDLYFPVLFGGMRSGTVLVPLNWRCTAPEIAYVLRDSDAALVLVDPEFLHVAQRAAAECTTPPTIIVTEDHPGAGQSLRALLEQPAQPGIANEGTADPSAVCVQLYTSGTTGRPKGALLTQSGLGLARQAELVLPDWADFTDQDTILSPMPNFHCAGLSWMLIGLLRGCTCVLTGDPSPANVLALCRAHSVSRTFIVPTVIRGLVDAVKADGLGPPPLRTIYYGAATIGLSLLHDAIATFGCGFAQFYGMTENTGSVTLLAPADHDAARPHLLGSVGRVLPGMAIEIRDPDGRPLPIDTAGEIWIKAPTLMQGYWKRPEATREALVDGWYRSGDGGYLDAEGFLYLTDRIRDMVISGGENVYPAEVEEEIRRHPAVLDAAVVGRPHEKWGEAVIAVVELRPDHALAGADLVAFLRPRLAGFKIPREVIAVPALPRTASGKIQRSEVRRHFL